MISTQLSLQIKDFLQEYLEFYKEFLALEKDKYKCLKDNEIKKLDGYVSKEQSYMLKSKGLELKRDNLLEKTGEKKPTFKELIELCADDSTKKELSKIYHELSEIMQDFKETNSLSNNILKLKLHRAEKTINQLNDHPELQKEYNIKASELNRSKGIISKKI